MMMVCGLFLKCVIYGTASWLTYVHVNAIAAFNPHQDTAIGRLHMVLLSFAKYFWSASLPATGRKLTNAEKEALDYAEAVLLSLSQEGLGNRTICADYMMRYRGSLVGRHLHSITQLGVFIFGHSAGPVLRQVWVTLSRLTAMLFMETIDDLTKFTVHVCLTWLQVATAEWCE